MSTPTPEILPFADLPALVASHAHQRPNACALVAGARRVNYVAAGLATTAGQHLRLDNDAPAAERLGAGASLFGGMGNAALAGRNAVPREELLALMFVEIHGLDTTQRYGIDGPSGTSRPGSA